MKTAYDMRCRDCQEIGCECPGGYLEEKMRCDVCGYEFVLSAARCVASGVRCPECAGGITEAG